MNPDLGTPLPRSTALALSLVVGAVVLAVPTTVVLLRALDGSVGSAVLGLGMVLVLVKGPLLLARGLLRVRVHVGPDAITRTLGGRVAHRIAYADVTRVRVKREPYALTITLWGTDPEGREVVFPVSRSYVGDLAPLARRLDSEVEHRGNGLFVDEHERRWWQEFRAGTF
ncbi:hypothetical protein [Nocardioides sp. Leaf285]|uniref:hypothetical protein n=1 Tax=Nocardioides sp. Leaf285 TaxID=1736322 RepID=UPI0007032543|nr:hypothetical protein [Nocardioides sp. Leaf285]KQP63022.1 hypothetical protein ASF47_18595 [Nocardioides sp. Leaf285]